MNVRAGVLLGKYPSCAYLLGNTHLVFLLEKTDSPSSWAKGGGAEKEENEQFLFVPCGPKMDFCNKMVSRDLHLHKNVNPKSPPAL